MFNIRGGWHCYKIDIEHVHHVSPQYLPTSSSHTVLSHYEPMLKSLILNPGIKRPKLTPSVTALLMFLFLEFISTGWWFQTFFIFHNIWDNPSH
jgi:hypothetical protein